MLFLINGNIINEKDYNIKLNKKMSEQPLKYNIAMKVDRVIHYHPSQTQFKAKLSQSELVMKFTAAREMHEVRNQNRMQIDQNNLPQIFRNSLQEWALATSGPIGLGKEWTEKRWR